jgi:DNA-directed RNA polymerase specialized sigma24 family protein
VSDLRQEAYLRVYEAEAKSRRRSPKDFLFATARHLVVDHSSSLDCVDRRDAGFGGFARHVRRGIAVAANLAISGAATLGTSFRPLAPEMP